MQKFSSETTGRGSGRGRPGARRAARAAIWSAAALGLSLAMLWLGGPLAVSALAVPMLEAAAERHGLDLEVGRVSPAGPGAVTLHAVELRRADEPRRALPSLRLQQVHARITLPTLLGALRDGGSWRDAVQLHILGAEVALQVNAEDGGDLGWLRARLEAARDALAQGGTGGEGARAPSRRWSVTVEGGFVTLDDVSGLLPGVGVRLERLDIRMGSDVPRRFRDERTMPAGPRVRGVVHVEGLGRALVRGQLGGGASAGGIEARMVQDNDLTLLLPERWRPRSEAALTLGAIRFEAPADFVLQPARGRGLEVPLPGPSGGVLDALWAHEIRVALRTDGLHVGVQEVRADVVLPGPDAAASALAGRDRTGPDRTAGGDRRMTLRLPEVSVHAPWGQGGGELRLRVEDSRARSLLVRAALGSTFTPRDVEVRIDHVTLEDFAPLLVLPGGGQLAGGLLEGDARWQRTEAGWQLTYRAGLLDGTLRSPALAEGWLQDVRLESSGVWESDRRAGGLRLRDAEVVVGEVPLEVAVARRGEGAETRWRLDLGLPVVEAERIRRSLPEGFGDALRGMRFAGALGVRVEVEVAVDGSVPPRLLVDAEEVGFAVLDHGTSLRPDALAGGFELTVSLPGQPPRRIGPQAPGWVSLADGVPLVARAILAAEDDRFRLHRGFDLRALAAAVQANMEARRLVRGGSTISQQVVKNLWTDGRRTLDRKLEEVLLTRELEAALEKERILELYLAMAHLGPGVFGVQEAARVWFGRGVHELELTEALFLGAILPAPEVYGRAYARGELPACRWEKMANILRNLVRAGGVSPEDAAAARVRLRQRIVSRVPPPSLAALEGRAVVSGAGTAL